MDIREVIAEATANGIIVEWGLEDETGDHPAIFSASERVADQIIAAIEAAPVEMRLAWAARLVGPDHGVVPVEPTEAMVRAFYGAEWLQAGSEFIGRLAAAIQAGAVKGEQ